MIEEALMECLEEEHCCAAALAAALLSASVDADGVEAEQPESVRTFARAGVMTTNEGLVLRFADGSEYQVTAVRSR